jgi:hypothetical protein
VGAGSSVRRAAGGGGQSTLAHVAPFAASWVSWYSSPDAVSAMNSCSRPRASEHTVRSNALRTGKSIVFHGDQSLAASARAAAQGWRRSGHPRLA